MHRVKDMVLNTTYEFKTLDKAVEFIEKEVKEKAYDAYNSNQIDKYAVEDILYDNFNYIKDQMGFEHNDLPNACYEIVCVRKLGFE